MNMKGKILGSLFISGIGAGLLSFSELPALADNGGDILQKSATKTMSPISMRMAFSSK